MRLSESDVRHYKEKGYLIAKNLLPLENVQRAFADFHIVFVQQLKRLGLAFSEGSGSRAADSAGRPESWRGLVPQAGKAVSIRASL